LILLEYSNNNYIVKLILKNIGVLLLNKRLLYKKAYAILNNVSPLKFDCGVLCNGACCKGEKNTGMYLYPGEEIMYESNPGLLKISKINFSDEYAKDILHAVCNGKCERSFRPLACRIFPLVPYISADGSLTIREDLRAFNLCPLIGQSKNQSFNMLFQRKVVNAFRLLINDEDIKLFIKYISSEINLYEKITGTNQFII